MNRFSYFKSLCSKLLKFFLANNKLQIFEVKKYTVKMKIIFTLLHYIRKSCLKNEKEILINNFLLKVYLSWILSSSHLTIVI